MSKDETIILLIQQTIKKITEYTAKFSNAVEFEKDGKTFDAVMMNFVVLGETISKLSNNFKNKNNHINWSEIKAFRNIIAHNYFGIDEYEVWQIIKQHLPKLKTDLNNIQ